MGQMSLYVTFAPTKADTIRTSLPKVVCLALRSHNALFYQGELVRGVNLYIPLTQAALFQMALLTLLCMDQGDMVHTPTERPRLVSDVIADVTPQGHAPCIWLRRLLLQSADDLMDGSRSLP